MALKEMLDAYADDAHFRERFLREARLTGQLEHPGVVPVYAVGSRADGRPYYAMRFVSGQTMQQALSEFHDGPAGPGRELGLRGLLTRFVAVCQTMAYAHSRGVIHRDLKPSNIILGEYGETLVVDWGIARSQADAAEEGPLGGVRPSGPGLTHQGQVLGTPGFMAPEQANGRHDRVGPRTDVFALGATLYCLLTGEPPTLSATTQGRARRDGFERPGVVNPDVPKALEAVCLKALAQEPEGRYASARDLAEDVERWLAGEPVRARRESLVERGRRWARRHRTVVTAALSLLLASVVGLGIGLWAVHQEYLKTASARDLAEDNLSLARQAVEEGFLLARDHPRLQDPRLMDVKKTMLERALPFFERFRARRADDPALAADEALNLLRVAYIQGEIGQEAEAVRHYERGTGQLAAVLDPAQERGRALELARSYSRLGVLLARQGNIDEGRKALAKCTGMCERMTLADPADLEARLLNAAARNQDATLLSQSGRAKETLAVLLEQRERQEELLGANPGSAAARRTLAHTLNNLVAVLTNLGRVAEGVPNSERVISLSRQLVEASPELLPPQRDLGRAWVGHASLFAMLGRREEARKAFAHGLPILERLAGLLPDVHEYQSDVAKACIGRSQVEMSLGDHQASLSFAERAADTFARLTQGNPEVTSYRHDLAKAHTLLGKVYQLLGRPDDATASLRRVAELYDTLHSNHPGVAVYGPELAKALFSLGRNQLDLKAPAEAASCFDRAIAVLDRLDVAEPMDRERRYIRFVTLASRAEALDAMGQHRLAAEGWGAAMPFADAPAKATLRITRATSQVRVGAYDLGAEEVRRLAQTPGVAAPTLHSLGRVLALASAGANADVTLPLPERDKRARLYADEAVSLFQQAFVAGFYRKPNERAALYNKILHGLREREDFRRLLAEVEAAHDK